MLAYFNMLDKFKFNKVRMDGFNIMNCKMSPNMFDI